MSDDDLRLLEPDELAAFHEKGFVHLRGVFDEAAVARGQQIISDALEQETPTISAHGSFTDRSHTRRIRDAIAHHAGLAEFLDHPDLIGPLVSVLGGSVQVLGTEIFVRGLSDTALESWHTDGGEYLQRIRLARGSQSLQVKAQVFLSDVSTTESGNFLLIPGSHELVPSETIPTCYIDELNEPFARGVMPPGAVTILAAPGDVLLFPYSLWHAVAPNTTRPRRTFIFRYGQLWHRPHDYLHQPPAVLDRMSPRLRRMFGDFGPTVHPTDYYKPGDQAAIMGLRGIDPSREA